MVAPIANPSGAGAAVVVILLAIVSIIGIHEYVTEQHNRQDVAQRLQEIDQRKIDEITAGDIHSLKRKDLVEMHDGKVWFVQASPRRHTLHSTMPRMLSGSCSVISREPSV